MSQPSCTPPWPPVRMRFIPGMVFCPSARRCRSLCATAGIVFIGPTADQIDAVGDKLRARAEAEAANVPVVPGGAANSPAEAADAGAEDRGAAAGQGGGRRRWPRHEARRPDRRPAAALDLAAAEAGAAFGDARVYLERYVDRGRHVEVQVLGDGDGRVIQLGERDCSVQRRYQKLIEETPAPGLSAALRDSLQQPRCASRNALRYRGAGTVEFIVDPQREAFYFLEMNARIQVEHPVTEAVTGIDLIAEQIAIADGSGLRLRQSEVRIEGCAIECRVNAEDHRNDFKPSPGRVREVSWPVGRGHSRGFSYRSGIDIPPFYDSLMGKIIASGPDRAGALARLRAAIAATRISGVQTNLGFHAAVLAIRNFKPGASIRDSWSGCMLAGRTSPSAARPVLPMADIQLVETSLRDGNQCLWAALGIDTARTLTIAPVMDRVGFRAIDFTTSTHMGVAVRYKKEDPWERIRLMAAATPNTPLQFMSTGFRFISWETASPDFMALAFRTLARNGIRRFCLADPMNDADSNMACARMVKQGGGEYVIVALVFTLSPIHDDAHYVERARKLAACPFIDALYIKDPGGLLSPARAQTLIPADQGGDRRQAAGTAFPLHHRARRTHLHGRTRSWRVGAAVCLRRCRRRHLEPAFRARGRRICGRWAIAWPSMMRRWAASTNTSPSWPRRRVCRSARRRPSMPATCSISCRAAWSAPRAASSPRRGCRTSKEP